MVEQQSQAAIIKFTDFFKKFVFITTGLVILYMLGHAASFFIFNKSESSILEATVINNTFFSNMVSISIIYFLIIVVAFCLYRKTKKNMLRELNKNLDSVRERAVLQTTQKISALMIQYISSYNAEIQQWLMQKQEQGRMPEVVAEASKNISAALLNFSRLAFIMPYLDKNFSSDEYLQSESKHAFLQLPYKEEL
jgi:hypothetical protein